ncbi:hypothetical protein HZA96_04755 [Candidatus Woesearchaeota archaeon]|nr:hypothetical protein [Candidatus Woesearchaeota archaeon]
MKTLVFDSGPIISLTINNLLWILDPLKKKFNGEFIITPSVYQEVITQPLSTRKYKLEALQVLPYINKKTLDIYYNKSIQDYAQYLLDLINGCFKAFGNDIQLVHFAEMEVVSCAKFLKAEAIVIDERTTRKLIEDPEGHMRYLEKKLGAKITVDKEKFQKMKEELKGLRVIRSIELAVISYELGLYKEFTSAKIKQMDLNKAVLEGVLWGIKLNGCSVREEEINEIVNLELKS